MRVLWKESCCDRRDGAANTKETGAGSTIEFSHLPSFQNAVTRGRLGNAVLCPSPATPPGVPLAVRIGAGVAVCGRAAPVAGHSGAQASTKPTGEVLSPLLLPAGAAARCTTAPHRWDGCRCCCCCICSRRCCWS